MGMNSRHEQVLSDTVSALSYSDTLPGLCHYRWQGEPLPSHKAAQEIVDLCRSLIFPGFFGDSAVNRFNVVYHAGLWMERLFALLIDQIIAGLSLQRSCQPELMLEQLKEEATATAEAFIRQLPELRRILGTDVRATYLGDPAATSTEEVVYCYPGIRAISSYRIAHALIELGVPVLPRMISELAHGETGADIHPGATIGEAFTIDHGTGIVIGATAIIGNNVKLYQGVTLGAKSFDMDDDGNPVKGVPRHPIIGNNVVIYSNSTILGRITIGDGAVIGGNLWITDNVAPGEKLVQAKPDNILRFQQ